MGDRCPLEVHGGHVGVQRSRIEVTAACAQGTMLWDGGMFIVLVVSMVFASVNKDRIFFVANTPHPRHTIPFSTPFRRAGILSCSASGGPTPACNEAHATGIFIAFVPFSKMKRKFTIRKINCL